MTALFLGECQGRHSGEDHGMLKRSSQLWWVVSDGIVRQPVIHSLISLQFHKDRTRHSL